MWSACLPAQRVLTLIWWRWACWRWQHRGQHRVGTECGIGGGIGGGTWGSTWGEPSR